MDPSINDIWLNRNTFFVFSNSNRATSFPSLLIFYEVFARLSSVLQSLHFHNTLYVSIAHVASFAFQQLLLPPSPELYLNINLQIVTYTFLVVLRHARNLLLL